jgi:MFS family permease
MTTDSTATARASDGLATQRRATSATGDWAGVYLKETVLSPTGVEALGFGAFSLTMLVGRLCGDRLCGRWGPVALGRAGALTAALGGLVVVGLPQVAPVLVGFALMGLGLSVLAPLAFSAIGRAAPRDPKPAIALVTALFYFGYVVSPPLIGMLAEWETLRVALSSIVVAALAAAALAFMLGREAPDAA